jgi:hypothetical protein
MRGDRYTLFLNFTSLHTYIPLATEPFRIFQCIEKPKPTLLLQSFDLAAIQFMFGVSGYQTHPQQAHPRHNRHTASHHPTIPPSQRLQTRPANHQGYQRPPTAPKIPRQHILHQLTAQPPSHAHTPHHPHLSHTSHTSHIACPTWPTPTAPPIDTPTTHLPNPTRPQHLPPTPPLRHRSTTRASRKRPPPAERSTSTNLTPCLPRRHPRIARWSTTPDLCRDAASYERGE